MWTNVLLGNVKNYLTYVRNIHIHNQYILTVDLSNEFELPRT